jgi:Mrp family chromosome partitioning ATPase
MTVAVSEVTAPTEPGDLTITTPDGKALYRFPAEITDSLRRMLTGLMYQSTLPRSVSCIAALPGEGVTYNSLALGATLAQDIDARICVVELNWWTPGLQAMLAGLPAATPRKWRRKKAVDETTQVLPPFPPSPGLAAVLREESSLDEALIKTGLSNLDLLPAGHVPLHQRPALARAEMLKQLVAELEERYDYLFFDIPAIAVTSDAIALASLSKATCVVVRQGITQTSTVKEALDAIKHLPILGVVLNRVQIHTPRWILNLLPQE